MERAEMQCYLDNLLEVGRFRDYCPNGLQVEGRAEIRRVVCGVTASQALLDAAVARKADAVLVHHGYFWRGEDGCITGLRRKRLGTLLGNDMNLFAYHLPLDAHPELGNNAQLGRLMGWVPEGRFAEQDMGWVGRLSQPTRGELLARQLAALERRLGQCRAAADQGGERVDAVGHVAGVLEALVGLALPDHVAARGGVEAQHRQRLRADHR